MNPEFFKSRVSLIVLGIGLGWLARILLGAPSEELGPPRTIDRPIQAVVDDVSSVSAYELDGESTERESGLVPPIKLPGTYAIFESSNQGESANRGESASVRLSRLLFDDYSHDPSASFEAHGQQLCASGCAISRHPTTALTKAKFERLMREFASGPMEESNASLEELLYFGPQTRRMIESAGVGELDRERASFLWDQLTYTHTRISIRVKDEEGRVRTWIEPTRVPFDRRHVFDMKTSDLQPLVTSGTIKRVGLNHLWTRL